MRAGANAGVVRQHSDVDPRARRPVWVVVALLWALEAAAVAVGVLPCAARVVAAHVLVRRVETLVALRTLAELIVREALVHAEAARLRSVGRRRRGVVGDRVRRVVVRVARDAVARRRAVAARRKRLPPDVRRRALRRRVRPGVVDLRVRGVGARVLDDDLAVRLRIVAAAVLVRPLDGDDGALVEVELFGLREAVEERLAVLVLHVLAADGAGAGVASLCVVLRVEEPVAIVAVHVALAVAVVGPARVVQVHIGDRAAQRRRRCQ
mmetsp:Transcript_10702/g.37840  ORF Transcript_10702/g.37840 Transcript_10702/m.37840 type:complete len:266 (+) Transcript_10702:2613-3410(+)